MVLAISTCSNFTKFWDCPSYNLQASFSQDNLRSSPQSVAIATQAYPGALLVGALPGGQKIGRSVWHQSQRNGIQNLKHQLGLRRRGVRTSSDCWL